MLSRLIITTVFSTFVSLAVSNQVHAAKITVALCESDYKELLSSIEFNRLAGIEQINQHLKGLTDEKERARLIEMREKSWDTEEEQRAMAGNIKRDCLAAVK